MSWLLEWISTHQSEIVAFFSSSTFLTIILLIRNIIKSNKDVKNNTAIGTKLTNALDAVMATKKSIDNSNDTNDELRKEIRDMLETTRINNNHVNALIDMVALMCSRSKDEDVRNQVAVIVNSLKYKDELTVEELRNEINELKNKLENSTVEDGKPQTTETEPVIDNKSAKSNSVSRG